MIPPGIPGVPHPGKADDRCIMPIALHLAHVASAQRNELNHSFKNFGIWHLIIEQCGTLKMLTSLPL